MRWLPNGALDLDTVPEAEMFPVSWANIIQVALWMVAGVVGGFVLATETGPGWLAAFVPIIFIVGAGCLVWLLSVLWATLRTYVAIFDEKRRRLDVEAEDWARRRSQERDE